MQKEAWSLKLLKALETSIHKKLDPMILQGISPLVALRVAEKKFYLDSSLHIKDHVWLLVRLGCDQELKRVRALLACEDPQKLHRENCRASHVFHCLTAHQWLQLAEFFQTRIKWPEVRVKCIERMWDSEHHYQTNSPGSLTGIGSLHKLLAATQEKRKIKASANAQLENLLMQNTTLLIDWLLAVWRFVGTAVRIQTRPQVAEKKLQLARAKIRSKIKNKASSAPISFAAKRPKLDLSEDFTLKCGAYHFACRRDWLIKTSSVLGELLQADPQCRFLSFDNYHVESVRRFVQYLNAVNATMDKKRTSKCVPTKCLDRHSPDFVKFLLMLGARDLLEMETQKISFPSPPSSSSSSSSITSLASEMDYAAIDPVAWVQMAQICSAIPGPVWFQKRIRCIQVVFLYLYHCKTRLASCVKQLERLQCLDTQLSEPFLQQLICNPVLIRDSILIAWNWIRTHGNREEARLCMPFPVTKISTILMDRRDMVVCPSSLKQAL